MLRQHLAAFQISKQSTMEIFAVLLSAKHVIWSFSSNLLGLVPEDS